MNDYRDRGTVVALAAALLVLTGAAMVVAGSLGSLSGWGVWVGAGLAIVMGILVLTRVQHTTTTVDQRARILTIEQRGLFGGPRTESIPFDAINSVVGRHIKLDEEYPEHALVLVLNDGSRRTLANHMSPERVDAVRDEIRASLEG